MVRPPRDAVDEILEQWRRERPDLDLQAMGIFGRLGRLATIAAKVVGSTLAAHDLNIGEFDVLSTLRRAGAPHRLTPTQLARTLMLSSSAMTNRLDQLEKAGLIERHDDPNDRRGILVGLTRTGLVRVEAAVTDHVANEARVLRCLTKTEQTELAQLLRKLAAAVELKPRD